jgi:membrane-bound ClpP family serine protease
MRRGANIGQGFAANAQHSKTNSAAKKAGTKKEKAESEAAIAHPPADEMPCMMSSSDAVKEHYAEAETADINEALSRAGLNDYKVVYYSPGFYEQLIDWFMKPYVSLLMVVLIAIGMRLQRKMPFPGPATFMLLATLALFCVPAFQGGLARAAELLIFLPLVIFTVADPLKKYNSRLLRIIPLLLLVAAIACCRAGSLDARSTEELLLEPGLTAVAFLTGWLAPVLWEKLSARFSSRMSSTNGNFASVEA